MTNGEKYKTAKERAEAFEPFCAKACEDCRIYKLDIANHSMGCAFAWLDLEVKEEEPLPCPFCGSRMLEEKRCSYGLVCAGCEYTTPFHKTIAEAIAAHNRVAKKCLEGK